MYEYYNSIPKSSNPILITLDNFYQLLLVEIVELMNKKEEEEEERKQNLNKEIINKDLENIFSDKMDSNENLINDKNEEMIKERFCIYIPDNIDNNENDIIQRDRYDTMLPKTNEKYMNIKTEPNINLNKKNNGLTLSKDNLPRQIINKPKIKLNKDKKNEIKTFRKDAQSGFTNIFANLKKDKPIKLKNKKEKEPEKNEKEAPKLRRLNEIKKKETSSLEAEIFSEVTNIKMLFSLEPKKRDLEQVKKKLTFYKEIKKKIAEAIGKPIKESEPPKTRHTFLKSVTVTNLNKKHKLKLHNNDGFFNVLDWDTNEIGDKLISISKNLLNKVQRKEIYKAIFLKNKKHETSPNVMENIDKSNRLTFFIIQDILSYDFAKDRTKIVEKWIKIAEYCKEKKDYNDCVAINLALNNYIITGLNKTMKDLSSEKKELMKTISRFCRYQGNYKKLREDMNKLEYNDFYIPYLGMILKDLAFFEENSKYIINGVLKPYNS